MSKLCLFLIFFIYKKINLIKIYKEENTIYNPILIREKPNTPKNDVFNQNNFIMLGLKNIEFLEYNNIIYNKSIIVYDLNKENIPTELSQYLIKFSLKEFVPNYYLTRMKKNQICPPLDNFKLTRDKLLNDFDLVSQKNGDIETKYLIIYLTHKNWKSFFYFQNYLIEQNFGINKIFLENFCFVQKKSDLIYDTDIAEEGKIIKNDLTLIIDVTYLKLITLEELISKPFNEPWKMINLIRNLVRYCFDLNQRKFTFNYNHKSILVDKDLNIFKPLFYQIFIQDKFNFEYNIKMLNKIIYDTICWTFKKQCVNYSEVDQLTKIFQIHSLMQTENLELEKISAWKNIKDFILSCFGGQYFDSKYKGSDLQDNKKNDFTTIREEDSVHLNWSNYEEEKNSLLNIVPLNFFDSNKTNESFFGVFQIYLIFFTLIFK